jgi:single-strand DNA-binding protein
MSSYEQVTLVGNLGQNPEMKYLESGRPVTNFSIAVNRVWKNQDGSQGEETKWIRCAAWGRTAEIAAEYLTKGREVMVIGRLTPDPATGGPRVYQASDGTWKSSFEVTVERLVLLGGRGESSGATASEDESPF